MKPNESNPSHPMSGRRAGRKRGWIRAALLGSVLLAACNYGFRGGGGFPSNIRTLYIEPFENQTVQFDLEEELYSRLLEELPRAFGVRPAGREVADAIVRGRIVRYDDVARNYQAGDDTRAPRVLEHEVQITVSVQVIDTQRNVILWESSGVTGRGTYRLDSQSDLDGRVDAIKELVQQIVDGAQSQW